MMLINTFCRKVQAHYGWDVERSKVVEETGEFLTEFGREPFGRSTREKLLEETVDMEICIHHVYEHYGFTESEINKAMRGKMQRTLDEIQKEKDRLETPLGKIGDRRDKA